MKRAAALAVTLCALSLECGTASAAFTPVPVGPPQATGTSVSDNQIAFSPDGTLVAELAATQTGAVSLYRTASTTPLSYAAGFGQLAGSPTSVGSDPTGVGFNPAGTLLAVSNFNDDSVSVFHVDPAGSTAALVPVTGSPYPINGVGPSEVTFSPDGSILAVSNQTSRTISLYSVAADGTLTESDNSPVVFPVASDALLMDVRFSPSGEFLAVPEGPENAVAMFAVSNGSDGPDLTELPDSPFSVNGTDAETVSFNAHGNLLAVTDADSGVSVLSVSSAGALTEVPGSPFTDGSSGGVYSDAEFSPSGNLLAAGDENHQAPGTTIFKVAAAGTLTAAATIAPPAGAAPRRFAWAPKNSSQGDVLAVDYGDFQLYSLGPIVTIATPANGSAYATSASVDARFTCADVLPITSCDGIAPSGSQVPLPFAFEAPLNETFFAVGTDSDGYTGSATTDYVDLPNTAALPKTPVTAGRDSVRCAISNVLSCQGKGGTISCSIASGRIGSVPTGACSGAAQDIQCSGSVGAITCSGVTSTARFTCKAKGQGVVNATSILGANLRCVGKPPAALACSHHKGKTICVFSAGATLTLADSPLAGDLSPLRVTPHSIVVNEDGLGQLSLTCPKNQTAECVGTLLITNGLIGEHVGFKIGVGLTAPLNAAFGGLARQGLSSTDSRGSALGVTTSVYAVALNQVETGPEALSAVVQAATQYGAITSAGISADYLTACGFTQIKLRPPRSKSKSKSTGSPVTTASSWSRVVNKLQGKISVAIPGF
jgi:6-phosphogluconolactonase (cycloisomerase 2 family)